MTTAQPHSPSRPPFGRTLLAGILLGALCAALRLRFHFVEHPEWFNVTLTVAWVAAVTQALCALPGRAGAGVTSVASVFFLALALTSADAFTIAIAALSVVGAAGLSWYRRLPAAG